MGDTGLPAETPGRVSAGPGARIARAAERLRDGVILGLHRLADRFDLVPPEFGRESPVDERDPKAVTAEWLRYLRLWADHNPEEIFALKVGGSLLLAAIVTIWLLIGIFF